jgi:hypothetical protein
MNWKKNFDDYCAQYEPAGQWKLYADDYEGIAEDVRQVIRVAKGINCLGIPLNEGYVHNVAMGIMAEKGLDDSCLRCNKKNCVCDYKH